MLKEKYPKLSCRYSDFLKVDGTHNLYYEESGNPQGKPVLFVHGGPGAGCKDSHRQYFNPEKYRIILFDQRGSGKSTPHANLENNTTWDLIADIEKIREKLGIKKWMLFGGSWGSTLSLASAQTHPERVTELILRGIFLARPQDSRWLYQFGAHHFFPEEWEKFIEPIPESERATLIQAYYKYLCSEDPKIKLRAAKALSTWEASISKLSPEKETLNSDDADQFALNLARLECHYMFHNCFFESENWLLENAPKISHIPTIIVHGRYDMVCPVQQAWELHKALPQSKLEIVHAGHSGSEVATTDALIRATDFLAQ